MARKRCARNAASRGALPLSRFAAAVPCAHARRGAARRGAAALQRSPAAATTPPACVARPIACFWQHMPYAPVRSPPKTSYDHVRRYARGALPTRLHSAAPGAWAGDPGPEPLQLRAAARGADAAQARQREHAHVRGRARCRCCCCCCCERRICICVWVHARCRHRDLCPVALPAAARALSCWGACVSLKPRRA